ncbi:hypothetical protein chiPu_0025809 [Chiloscyllium punctatum]|uniref:Uncharacterized protein n=1 Tax=Chiloscyllium punctatum TaxID=137246 RepID=A0A401TGY8_CHIPU|nr:hypothetical protein [Chiloscyllium punctatum]
MEPAQSVSLMDKLKGLSQEQLSDVLNSPEKQDSLLLDSEEVRESACFQSRAESRLGNGAMLPAVLLSP